jgi:hypothetical protein
MVVQGLMALKETLFRVQREKALSARALSGKMCSSFSPLSTPAATIHRGILLYGISGHFVKIILILT